MNQLNSGSVLDSGRLFLVLFSQRERANAFAVVILRVVMDETIGERHASACRYKNEVPEGSRRSARRTHFCPRGVSLVRFRGGRQRKISVAE